MECPGRQMTWDLSKVISPLTRTERNQYIAKSRLSLKFSRLTLGEDYAEFILQRTPHKTHSGTDTILEGMHSKFTNGGAPIPALLNKTSNLPNLSWAVLNNLAIESESDTSV